MRKVSRTGQLTATDLKMFSRFKIPRSLVRSAGVQRVDDSQARALGIGRKAAGNMQGILYAYCDPETSEIVASRVRRDHPEIEEGKPKGKYICPKGARLIPYVLPQSVPMLKDASVPIVLVEAEKSVLALTAWASRTKTKLIAVGMGGCWGWSKNQKPKPALLRVCKGHRVYVLLDANAATNETVKEAQAGLTAALHDVCSELLIAATPQMQGVNGPDDLLAQQQGDTLLAEVLDAAGEPSALGKFSEDELALMFTIEHGDDLRYVDAWGAWYAFNGHRWQRDETLSVYDKAREICRAAAATCGKKQIAQRIRSAHTIAAVERLARADRQHAATVEQWDADLWSLNTPDGVVDLHTGKLRPILRSDYMTKITAVAPGGDCPLWQKVLSEVTAGDKELQAYIQRMFGYILTGVTSEHALFFLYGTGANGKSVVVNTIAGILSDYARVAPIETFIASHNEAHPTDLASLQGARMVTATETEDGTRWAESKLKALTGGDRIAARFMHRDFFEFSPQLKLTVQGNRRPGLRNVDEAMRRRMNLVPFSVTIPPAKRDPRLTEKLRTEWGGILQWMIEGCLAWQKVGLAPPKAVSAATDSYLAAEDAMGRWLDERCMQAKNYRENSTQLFQSWRRWAESTGEFVGSQKNFSQKLVERGYTLAKGREGNSFVGLKIRGVEDVEGEPIIGVGRISKSQKVSTGISGSPSTSSTKKYAAARLALIRGGK